MMRPLIKAPKTGHKNAREIIAKEADEKMMKMVLPVYHFRRGFATNSSSVHSIIIPDFPLMDREYEPYNYGWERFILASREAKQKYLKTVVACNIMNKGIPVEFLQYLGADVPSYAYIDHQSLMTLPRNKYGWSASWDFFKEFADWVLNSDVAIVGGNDNDLDGMSWWPGKPVEFDFLSYLEDYSARKNGNYWVLVDRETGNHVRVKFHSDDFEPEFPELIDINVTDYCEYNCPFCYRGSTTDGRHADRRYIERIFESLPPGTEIAIGGGDPMSHPEIARILADAVGRYHIVNVTVRGTKWLENDELVDAVKKYVSGLGVSVNSARDAENALEKILSVFDEDKFKPQVTIHYIPSLGDEQDLRDLFAKVREKRNKYVRRNMSILLLGYKTSGRGGNVTPKRIENLHELIRTLADEHYMRVGVDTKMFDEYPEIHKITREIFKPDPEGTFSMFIDAVRQEAYATSYSEEQGIPLNMSYRSWGVNEDILKNAFRTIRQRVLNRLAKNNA